MSLLLAEIGGIPNEKLLKYPYLTCKVYSNGFELAKMLSYTDKRLSDILRLLSGKPLYLDNYQLQHVLTEFPKLLDSKAINVVSWMM